MTKCIKCGCSMNERMLHRTSPIGKSANWMCMPCIEKYEPELAKDLKQDDGYEILAIVEDVCLHNK